MVGAQTDGHPVEQVGGNPGDQATALTHHVMMGGVDHQVIDHRPAVGIYAGHHPGIHQSFQGPIHRRFVEAGIV